MSDADADAGAPWLRLSGALLLGFGILALVADVSFMALIERAQQTQDSFDPDAYERREQAYRLLDIMSTANLCGLLVGGWSVAIAFAAFAASAPRLRALAGLTALAYAASSAYWLRWLILELSGEHIDDPNAFEAWLLTSEIGQLAATAGAAAILVLRTRSARRRNPALAGAAVGLAVALVRLLVPLTSGEQMPSWWLEPLLGLRTSGWVLLAGTLGLGTALWLAADPDGDAPRRRFDAVAARALRLARAVVWWRLVLALGSVVLVIAAASAARRAQHSLMIGGSAPPQSTWIVELVPWLGLVELGLGVLMIVALGATVLQQRSRLAAALVAAGTLVLLAVAFGSYALDMALFEAARGNMPGVGWGGTDARTYTELAAETQPTFRWLGLLGLGTTLGGLVVLARITGHGSPTRAVRLLVIAIVITAGWLHGREALEDLGMIVLLLAPLLLGAAVWMLLDLVTFLREVAEGLDAESPPDPSPP
jgi:hypothetical protein